MGAVELSGEEARRLVLAAQGFLGPRKATATPWRKVSESIDTMGLLQLDSVNVLLRSHYLPAYARLGPYDRASFDKRTLGAKQRNVFEYWAHEASLLPFDSQPLLRWRMADAKRGTGLYKGLVTFEEQRRDYIDGVLEEVRQRGPLRVADLSQPGERRGPWWGWCDGKIALEYLFWTGDVTTAKRQGFERIYDIPERVIPQEVLDQKTPSKAEAMRRLMTKAAQALGIGTESDLRDYYRLPVAAARKALHDLVEEGTLVPAKVAAWQHTAYLPQGMEPPARATPSALLSPFDPLVWARDRTERLFDFHYRLEFYTPAAKRRFGYFVMPYLHRGRLAARVDLKADRPNNRLLVLGAFGEDRIKTASVAAGLAQELKMLRDWLGFDSMTQPERGDLAPALRLAL